MANQIQGLGECSIEVGRGSHCAGNPGIFSRAADDGDCGLTRFKLLPAYDDGAYDGFIGAEEQQCPLALAVYPRQGGNAVATVAADVFAVLVHQGLIEYKKIALGGAHRPDIDCVFEAARTVGEGDEGQCLHVVDAGAQRDKQQQHARKAKGGGFHGRALM